MKLLENIKKLNSVEVKIDEFKLCIFIFMCCGIFGFFVEETYDILHNWKLDKNGFLYGLFLPIYAWGGLIFHFIAKKTKNKPIIAFLMVVLTAALLEYCAGAVILEIWNKRFWNYSDYFMNLNGHICLFSVVSFGILGTLYIYVLEPLIKMLINKLGSKKVDICLKWFLVLYLIDNICSFLIKNKF